MSDAEKVMADLTALKEEFGVEFQIADPGAPVTVEQHTINNLFFALLEARAALGDAKPRPGTDSPVPRTYWFKEPDDDTEAALGDVEPDPVSMEDVLADLDGKTLTFTEHHGAGWSASLGVNHRDGRALRFFRGDGPTIDAALRDAVASVKGGGR